MPGKRKNVKAIKPVKKIYPSEIFPGEMLISFKTNANTIPAKK